MSLQTCLFPYHTAHLSTGTVYVSTRQLNIKVELNMGSKPKTPDAPPPPAPPPSAADPTRANAKGGVQRRARLKAKNRTSVESSVLAGETGGFQPVASAVRAGKSVLG